MKTHGLAEYSRLFNASYSRYMRGIQDRIGLMLLSELIMLAVTVIMWRCGFGGGGYWGMMPVIIINAAVNEGIFSSYGNFCNNDRKNLFYRTIPGRRKVLKKALVTAEINRFLCVAVFSASTETAMAAEGKIFRVYNAVFNMMLLYMVVSLAVYFFRIARPLGIASAVSAGIILLLVSALLKPEITSAGAAAVSAAGILFSVFLDYMVLRKLSGSDSFRRR